MIFEWNTVDSVNKDVYIAKKGTYLLRCERLDDGVWWWAAYSNSLEIDGSIRDTEVPEDEKTAKELCEYAVKNHWASKIALQKIKKINRSLVNQNWRFDEINALWNECIAIAVSQSKRKEVKKQPYKFNKDEKK